MTTQEEGGAEVLTSGGRPPQTPPPLPPVVGLRRQREVLTVALDAGRHVVIEGPPGTGKSTLLRAIARDSGRDVVFVEGNAELTPARLIGQHDPSQVIAAGYTPGGFTDGPLLQAMRQGALLYLEEFNRVPEETLNVLITVLTEGEIAVPRLGAVRADPGFRLIAAMNPFDAVGTARVSHAIADRICRIVLGYQDAAAEQAITTAITGLRGRPVELAVDPDPGHPRAPRRPHGLIGARRDRPGAAGDRAAAATRRGPTAYAPRSGDAAHADPLSRVRRIRIADGCDRSPESVLDEIIDQMWPADSEPDDPAEDGQGKADGLPADAAGQPTTSPPTGEPAPARPRAVTVEPEA